MLTLSEAATVAARKILSNIATWNQLAGAGCITLPPVENTAALIEEEMQPIVEAMQAEIDAVASDLHCALPVFPGRRC